MCDFIKTPAKCARLSSKVLTAKCTADQNDTFGCKQESTASESPSSLLLAKSGGGGSVQKCHLPAAVTCCSEQTKEAADDHADYLPSFDKEQLLVEIVTLNKALVAAREGNFKILQVSASADPSISNASAGANCLSV